MIIAGEVWGQKGKERGVVLYGLVGNSEVTSSSVDPDYWRKIAITLIDPARAFSMSINA
jgi:hypothetical protein